MPAFCFSARERAAEGGPRPSRERGSARAGRVSVVSVEGRKRLQDARGGLLPFPAAVGALWRPGGAQRRILLGSLPSQFFEDRQANATATMGAVLEGLEWARSTRSRSGRSSSSPGSHNLGA